MGEEPKEETMLKQASVRIEEEQYDLFKETADKLGTTPTDALRMFIYAFNRDGGFPNNMSLNLSRIPPQFRKTYTPEELAERMRQADADIEAGKFATHEEVFAGAYKIIEEARLCRDC